MTSTTTTALTEPSPALAADPQASDFYSKLSEKNAAPLWTVMNKLVTPSPSPTASTNIWRYADMRSSLMEAGKVVSAEEADRRVLMLVNPSMDAPCTTDSIYSGLQLVLPGETAPAHRHVAFALRFIIEGSQGFTAVEGEKMMMERGDVILTPSWQWHDHGNSGDEPVIWLDGLDLPLYKFLSLNFFGAYHEPRYPSTLTPSSKLKFPWAPVEKALNETEGPYAVHHYAFEDGRPLSQTLSAQAERIEAGTTSPSSQETVSFVYHVVEGEGYSIISSPGTEELTKVMWTAKDTFAVPAWSRVTHTSSQDADTFLFAINDRPMVNSLGLARKA